MAISLGSLLEDLHDDAVASLLAYLLTILLLHARRFPSSLAILGAFWMGWTLTGQVNRSPHMSTQLCSAGQFQT